MQDSVTVGIRCPTHSLDWALAGNEHINLLLLVGKLDLKQMGDMGKERLIPRKMTLPQWWVERFLGSQMACEERTTGQTTASSNQDHTQLIAHRFQRTSLMYRATLDWRSYL